MKEFISKLRSFLADEGGPTAIEYALMLALIVIVCLAVIRSVGTFAFIKFRLVANSLK